MPYLDVYIGFFDNTLNENWYLDEHIQYKQSPFFPSREIFYKIIHMIESGDLEGKQLDWGAWGAKVTKQRILEIIDEEYGEKWISDNEKFPRILPQYYQLLEYVNSLRDDVEYAIIASEL